MGACLGSRWLSPVDATPPGGSSRPRWNPPGRTRRSKCTVVRGQPPLFARAQRDLMPGMVEYCMGSHRRSGAIPAVAAGSLRLGAGRRVRRRSWQRGPPLFAAGFDQCPAICARPVASRTCLSTGHDIGTWPWKDSADIRRGRTRSNAGHAPPRSTHLQLIPTWRPRH